jgi:hypothetical protein
MLLSLKYFASHHLCSFISLTLIGKASKSLLQMLLNNPLTGQISVNTDLEHYISWKSESGSIVSLQIKKSYGIIVNTGESVMEESSNYRRNQFKIYIDVLFIALLQKTVTYTLVWSSKLL